MKHPPLLLDARVDDGRSNDERQYSAPHRRVRGNVLARRSVQRSERFDGSACGAGGRGVRRSAARYLRAVWLPLRAWRMFHVKHSPSIRWFEQGKYGGGGRIRTHGRASVNSFQDCRLQPLGHASASDGSGKRDRRRHRRVASSANDADFAQHRRLRTTPILRSLFAAARTLPIGRLASCFFALHSRTHR